MADCGTHDELSVHRTVRYEQNVETIIAKHVGLHYFISCLLHLPADSAAHVRSCALLTVPLLSLDSLAAYLFILHK